MFVPLLQQSPMFDASRSCLIPAPPNMTIQKIEYKTGAVKVPLINCLIVLPFEIFAINMPVKLFKSYHELEIN